MSIGKGQNQVSHVDKRPINSIVAERNVFNNQNLLVKLSSGMVSINKGVIKIGAELTRNNQPVELVEGKHTSIFYRPSTNSIVFDFKEQGLVGSKAVDEINIGDGKILIYDSELDKLVYIDLHDAVISIVNSLPKNEFVSKEVPAGSIDGINKIFTTSKKINFETEQVFLNGLLLEPGIEGDYVVDGDDSIIFNIAPRVNWKIKVSYVTEVI